MTETAAELRLRHRATALALAEILEGPRRIGTPDSDINPMPFILVDQMLARHAREIRKELNELLP